MTSYVAVVGPRTAWPGSTPIKHEDIADTAGETIHLVEVADSRIPWTEPRDLSLADAARGVVNPGSGAVGISTFHGRYINDLSFPRGPHVLMCDISLRPLAPEISRESLISLLTTDSCKTGNGEVFQTQEARAATDNRKLLKVVVFGVLVTCLFAWMALRTVKRTKKQG